MHCISKYVDALNNFKYGTPDKIILEPTHPYIYFTGYATGSQFYSIHIYLIFTKVYPYA